MCLLSLKVHTEEARSQGAIMLIFSTNRVHKYMTSTGKAEEIMADREERERESAVSPRLLKLQFYGP